MYHLHYRSIASLAPALSKTKYAGSGCKSTIRRIRRPHSPLCLRAYTNTPQVETPGQKRCHASTSPPTLPRLSAAIVGAGPSGFYTAKYLASSFSKQITSQDNTAPLAFSGIDIDILERLPTPYGLVRYGVAPDHPEVKNVENDFASVPTEHQIIEYGGSDGTNRQCTVSYFGNVDVGYDISLQQLSSIYDIVVLAYGCQSDKNLGIPGLQLKGVLTARQFVAWYNGHPEFGYVADIVKQCLWPNNSLASCGKEKVSKARVVVIGNGNVALDCARVLVKGKRGLESTDTPTSVLDVLGGGVEKVTVAGRRGHVQGAFTIKELRELTKLQKEGYDASFHVRQDELDMGMTESSIQELKGAHGRPKTRIDALLRDVASEDPSKDDAPKSVELRLLMNPIRIESNNPESKRVSQVTFERTKLEGEPGKQKCISTGKLENIPTDLVIVSVGYKGVPLEQMDAELFDNFRGVVANVCGKVCGENNIFVSGWIKRGPTGIIGTNITDAKETVASIMKYIHSESQQQLSKSSVEDSFKGREGLIRHLDLQGVKSVTWDQFLHIDEAERDRERLRNDSQPREKILSIDEMLSCLR